MGNGDEVDVDEATVEVIRANDAQIKRLRQALAEGGTDEEQVRLAAELVNASRRQEGVLSEVPGLEDRGRKLADTRAELERYYDLSG